MGDRTHLEFEFMEIDKSVVDEVLGSGTEEPGPAPGWLTRIEEEANYGLLLQREILAARGVALLGHHGSGGGYNAAVFVSVGGEHVECASLEHGGPPAPVVDVDEDGQLHEGMLRNARRYWKLVGQIRAVMQDAQL